MKIPFDRSCLRSALERMDIADIAQATIRQSGDIARTMERDTGVEFPVSYTHLTLPTICSV